MVRWHDWLAQNTKMYQYSRDDHILIFVKGHISTRYQRNGFSRQILKPWTPISQKESAHDSQEIAITACFTVAPGMHDCFHPLDRRVNGLLPKDFLCNGIAHDIPSSCREVGEIAEHITDHIDLMAVMTQAMSQLL